MRALRGAMTGSRSRIAPAILAVLVLTTGAACGSRLDTTELQAANGAFTRVSDADAAPTAGDSSALGFEDSAGGAVATDSGTGGTASGSTAGAGSSGATGPAGQRAAAGSSTRTPAAATAAGTASAASQQEASPGAAATPGATAPGTPVPGTPQPGAPAEKKSELLLGSFGAESGILGAVSGPAPPAIRAWAAYINTRGGVNGHPVKVILGDDNANPARSQAIVRQMVEQDKVVAFFNDYSFTLDAVMPYLEQKKIPIIGSIGGHPAGDHSPMMFNPLLGPDVGQAWGFILNTLTQAPGKKKIGILYCREASVCGILKDAFKKLLPYEGLEVVYEAFVSLAQPDYTGEMIQAQNAGADVILPLIDTAALNRVVTAARRQNYEPAFVGTYNLNQDLIYNFGDNLEGIFLTSRMGPWDTSPLNQTYRDAMARYQPKAARGDLGAGVFVAGKLLAEKIGPFIKEPPKTEQILEGLYSLNNETLGGLLPGVGFKRDAEHVDTNQCIIPVKFTGGRFVAQPKFVCAPNWKPVGS
ncbi:MAG: ABC transporter substrate-binding protein [Acidimicrobiia bacterium]